jgi:predicted amidohydrolase YtcJ
MNRENPNETSFVIINKKFSFVGNEADSREFLSSNNLSFKTIDLNGHSIIPGY